MSIDCVCEAGSTQAWRADAAPSQPLIELFRVRLGQDRLEWESAQDLVVKQINSEGTSEIPVDTDGQQRKGFNESLYSLGNLRKRLFADHE